MDTKKNILFFTSILVIFMVGCGNGESKAKVDNSKINIDNRLPKDKQDKLDKEIKTQIQNTNSPDYKVTELSAEKQAKLDKEIEAQIQNSKNTEYKLPDELSAEEQTKLDKEIEAQIGSAN